MHIFRHVIAHSSIFVIAKIITITEKTKNGKMFKLMMVTLFDRVYQSLPKNQVFQTLLWHGSLFKVIGLKKEAIKVYIYYAPQYVYKRVCIKIPEGNT